MGVGLAIVSAGVSIANGIGQFNDAKSEARRLKAEGAIRMKNRAEDIKQLASRQRVSYLAAGLELEGTPQNVINDTYNVGIQDVLNIGATYRQKAQNVVRQGRAALLGSVTSSISNFAGSGMFSGSAAAPIQDVVDVTGTTTGVSRLGNTSFTNASYMG